MKEVKKKHSVWLSESAWADVEHHYQADNCSTKNEYIEKAIQFYSGYLDTEHAEEYLPRVLADVLEGKLEPVWCMAKTRKEKDRPCKKTLNCCNSSAACRVSENTA